MSNDERLLDGTFKGEVEVSSWQGKFVSLRIGGGLFGSGVCGSYTCGYSDSSWKWRVQPSPRGGFFFSCQPTTGGTYYWQADGRDQWKMKMHTGADDWESFRMEKHGDGWAFKNVASGKYLCAEPDSHSVHLIANRDNKAAWEKFSVRVLSRAD